MRNRTKPTSLVARGLDGLLTTTGVLASLLLAGGCTAVLGIDKDYYLDGEGGSGGAGAAGGTGGAGGAGAAGGTGGAGATGGSTTTTPGACETAADCPSEEPECKSAVGCEDGACVFQITPAGTPLAGQIAGDCTVIVCDGEGASRKDPLSTDIEDDGKPCTLDACDGTTPTHLPQDAAPCYSGPDGTEGTGACKAGFATCDAEGNVVGKCNGEVLPQTEVCDGLVDGDCDGLADPDEGCLCVPGSVEVCYSGPAGTAGISVCQTGLRTCQSNGLAWDKCTGQVTPTTEVCSSLQDESCDGLSGCPGVHLWSKRFGDAQLQYARTVAGDAQGNTLVAGDFDGSIDFGGGALSGLDSLFVTKLGPTGDHVWSKKATGTISGPSTRIAVAPTSHVIVTGSFNGSLSLGGDVLVNNEQPNVFVARLDPDGAPLWTRQFGDAASQSPTALAVDSSGNTLVAGSFAGAIDFGGGPLTGNIFVAKLDPAGNHVWSKAYSVSGGSAVLTVRGLGTDALGNVVFGGAVNGSTNLGGADVLATSTDLYLAKLGAAGQFVWSKQLGSPSADVLTDVAVDGSGNVVLTGYHSGTLNLGGPDLVGGGSLDVFVAKLDPTGAHLWSKTFGDTDVQTGEHVAVDGAGNVLVSGYFLGEFGLGGQKVTAVGAAGDVFLGKLDPAGNHLWSRSFGNPDPFTILDGTIAADPYGNVLFAGGLAGPAALGGAVLTSAGSYDVAVAKLSP